MVADVWGVARHTLGGFNWHQRHPPPSLNWRIGLSSCRARTLSSRRGGRSQSGTLFPTSGAPAPRPLAFRPYAGGGALAICLAIGQSLSACFVLIARFGARIILTVNVELCTPWIGRRARRAVSVFRSYFDVSLDGQKQHVRFFPSGCP